MNNHIEFQAVKRSCPLPPWAPREEFWIVMLSFWSSFPMKSHQTSSLILFRKMVKTFISFHFLFQQVSQETTWAPWQIFSLSPFHMTQNQPRCHTKPPPLHDLPISVVPSSPPCLVTLCFRGLWPLVNLLGFPFDKMVVSLLIFTSCLLHFRNWF